MERLTPPWIRARVLRREGGIDDGGRILLAIRQGPAQLKWDIQHTDYEEGRLFQDEQRSGPFRVWRHSHRFTPTDDGGCVMEDEVEWALPAVPSGGFPGQSFVEKELRRLFSFRHARLRHDLDLHSSIESEEPMKIAVSGASGLIGRSLVRFLETGGHEVARLTRRRDAGGIFWDYEKGEVDKEALEGLDGVVHLAGEPIFGLRWSPEKKTRIRESRQKGTEFLAKTLAGLSRKPKVLVSGSAVGVYGDRGSEPLSEESRSGKGFLADVCRAWERASEAARKAGIRVVTVRTGMVLTPAGGALGTMLLPFKLGLGGRLGSGRQYVSWIDLDDEVGLIHHALTQSSVQGALNAVAPHPVPNSTFTSTLGRILGRPTLIPVPSLAIKTLFGEMGEALLLDGARVLPKKAEETGYVFRYPSLEESLRHQLGRPEAGV
jgi:uncharacterized protein (TIGR01777 family)